MKKKSEAVSIKNSGERRFYLKIKWKDRLILRSRTNPPKKSHLNVKKLPKTWHFIQQYCKKLSFFQKKIANGNGGSGPEWVRWLTVVPVRVFIKFIISSNFTKYFTNVFAYWYAFSIKFLMKQKSFLFYSFLFLFYSEIRIIVYLLWEFHFLRHIRKWLVQHIFSLCVTSVTSR